MAADEEVGSNDPLDDLVDIEETGGGSSIALLDAFPVLPVVGGAAAAVAAIYLFQTNVRVKYPAAIASWVKDTTDALADAINDGIIPVAQAGNFWFWLAYNIKVAFIPTVATYAFVQGYIVQWAQENGWATMGPNPLPTPLATQAPQSVNAPAPLPGTVNPPAALPSPTVGQSTVARGAREIVPSQVPAADLTPAQAAAVQAAIGVASVDILKAHAAVNDLMLGALAPGQVPQALSQLNTAVSALEAQMAQVRAGEWPRGYQGTLQALNGGLEALYNVSLEVGNLADQLAEKAGSALETTVDNVSAQAKATAASVAVILDTSIPGLAEGLGTLTGQVGDLATDLATTVTPELASLSDRVAATEATLALTTEECLAALCGSQEDVTDPITEGGATPSLLKQLGSLLTRGLEIGALMSLVEGLVTLANTKIAVNAIISDTETITGWAVKAAGVIETDFDLSGWG
jgi:hypothetical protein